LKLLFLFFVAVFIFCLFPLGDGNEERDDNMCLASEYGMGLFLCCSRGGGEENGFIFFVAANV